MAKFKIPEMLVDKCPYDEVQIHFICSIVDKYEALLNEGYESVVKFGSDNGAPFVVHPDAWKFMLADHAYEDAHNEFIEHGASDSKTLIKKHVIAWIALSVEAAKNPKSSPAP